MDITTLFTLAKVAYASNITEAALGQKKPLNFKVGDSNIRKIMEDTTAKNFRQKLEEHPDLERVLNLFADAYAFVPLISFDDNNIQERYLDVLNNPETYVQSEARRFVEVAPEVGEMKAFYVAIRPNTLKETSLIANYDSEIQKVFATVTITEDMVESKYQRKLIAALKEHFGDRVSDALWNEDELSFKLGKIPMTQYGLPIDDEEDEEDGEE